MVEETQTKAAAEPKTVTGTVVLASKSFVSGPVNDDDARTQFIDGHKGKIKPDTVTMVDKRHDIGVGITYTFSAEAK